MIFLCARVLIAQRSVAPDYDTPNFLLMFFFKSSKAKLSYGPATRGYTALETVQGLVVLDNFNLSPPPYSNMNYIPGLMFEK